MSYKIKGIEISNIVLKVEKIYVKKILYLLKFTKVFLCLKIDLFDFKEFYNYLFYEYIHSNRVMALKMVFKGQNTKKE